jgi:hypothetical protein
MMCHTTVDYSFSGRLFTCQGCISCTLPTTISICSTLSLCDFHFSDPFLSLPPLLFFIFPFTSFVNDLIPFHPPSFLHPCIPFFIPASLFSSLHPFLHPCIPFSIPASLSSSLHPFLHPCIPFFIPASLSSSLHPFLHPCIPFSIPASLFSSLHPFSHPCIPFFIPAPLTLDTLPPFLPPALVLSQVDCVLSDGTEHRLGKWIDRQRQKQREKTLSPEREALLQTLVEDGR